MGEAVQEDVGRFIVRLSSGTMEELGVIAGDVIEIRGKSKATASVRRTRPEDEGIDLIRMDPVIRANAQASLGEEVEVSKAVCHNGEAVELSPVEKVEFSGDPAPFFHDKLLDKPLLAGQQVEFDLMGTTLYYVVTKTKPQGCVKVSQNTRITILDRIVKPEQRIAEVSYEDIGGLKEEIELVREMIEVPIKHPEVFQRLGIGAPKGVLLTGPPGTGKTLLAKAVSSETDSRFFSIAGPEIMSKFYGESEKQLRDIFEEAGKNAPSIIFIDEIDSIAPKRGEGHDQVEKRVVAQLLASMDGLKSRGNVVVIAATNRPDDLDEALRRPGRFDREIRIMPPNERGRKEILQIHSRGMPLSKDVDISILVGKTLGFTGADLEVLCKEAAMKALKPYVQSLKGYEEKVPANVLQKIEVTMDHFSDALKTVEPSAMREILITKPEVRWEDIGGLDTVKERIREAIEWPLKNPESFRKFGITPPKGILLYGPSGTGKTLLAKAIATESDANFIPVKGPELVSKWVGESEKHIREVFKKAKNLAPAIIFFDEFDSISKVRGSSISDSTERMVNQLLNELDGVEELNRIAVIAATNRPELIDPALLRPGRIGMLLEVPLPGMGGRLEILKVHTREMPIEGVDLESYASKTEGWSGADLSELCREAGMVGLRRWKSSKGKVKVTGEDFRESFESLKARTKEKDMKEGMHVG